MRVRGCRFNHCWGTHVAVLGDPLSMIIGDVRPGQQAPAQREPLGMLVDPGGADCLLVGRPPFMDDDAIVVIENTDAARKN